MQYKGSPLHSGEERWWRLCRWLKNTVRRPFVTWQVPNLDQELIFLKLCLAGKVLKNCCSLVFTSCCFSPCPPSKGRPPAFSAQRSKLFTGGARFFFYHQLVAWCVGGKNTKQNSNDHALLHSFIFRESSEIVGQGGERKLYLAGYWANWLLKLIIQLPSIN